MSDFAKFLIKAFLRKGLTALGTYLLARGVLTESEAGGFAEEWLEMVLGALILAASSAWTFVYNSYVRDKVKTALELPSGASSERLAKAMGEKR